LFKELDIPGLINQHWEGIASIDKRIAALACGELKCGGGEVDRETRIVWLKSARRNLEYEIGEMKKYLR